MLSVFPQKSILQIVADLSFQLLSYLSPRCALHGQIEGQTDCDPVIILALG